MSKISILGILIFVSINVHAGTAPKLAPQGPAVVYNISKDLLALYGKLVGMSDDMRVAENELKELVAMKESGSGLTETQSKRLSELPSIIDDLEEKLKLHSAELWHGRYSSKDLDQLKKRSVSDQNIFITHDPEANSLLSSLKIKRSRLLEANADNSDIVKMLERVENHILAAHHVHVHREKNEALFGGGLTTHDKTDLVESSKE